MLANQYFDIDAKIARPAQDFDYAASGGNAGPREACDLDVYNGAI